MNKTLLTFAALTLGTAPVGLPALAADGGGMAGMDMGGAKAAAKPVAAPLSVAATVNPAAPRTGDNALDLTITGPDGKPATGLKLTTSVAMTSMDMGTTHPAFTEKGGGHYAGTVNFSMDGPWRVVVRSGGGKVAVLDFNAGSKTPWKPPYVKTSVVKAAPVTPSAPTAPAVTAPAADKSGSMAGMDMGVAPPKPDKPQEGGGMAGMDMGMSTGIADMKTAPMPELKETGTYTATGNEDWKQQTGFGHNAPMVGMMNQMMVGGSGMEGMKMAPMKMKFDEQNYAKPEGGGADPGMPGMDMGGLKDAAPVKITAATASAPKAGDNALTLTLTDAQGKPLAGARITTSVAMTSMDMGTTHPAVTEKGGGQYAAAVNFSMAGPWRVTVTVTPPGRKPQAKAFDFTAK